MLHKVYINDCIFYKKPLELISTGIRMAFIMNKHNLISLLFATSLLTAPLAFAESPAAMDDAANTDIEPVFIDTESDARPADNETNTADKDSADTLKVKTETVESGTVLNTSDKAGEPLLVRKLDFPRRGMSEDKVKNELGSPNEIRPAVGKPPISQWIYDDRIVYFERATVLHVVAK